MELVIDEGDISGWQWKLYKGLYEWGLGRKDGE